MRHKNYARQIPGLKLRRNLAQKLRAGLDGANVQMMLDLTSDGGNGRIKSRFQICPFNNPKPTLLP